MLVIYLPRSLEIENTCMYTQSYSAYTYIMRFKKKASHVNTKEM